MIRIEKCGPLTTIQDHGRRGYKRIGVGCGGPYDRQAYLAGQCLLRNEGKACVEMFFYPFRVTFTLDMTIAVTGASDSIRLDDEPRLSWSRFYVRAGQTLVINQPSPGRGIASYMSVYGGIISEEVLGSKSADLKARFSGLCGREITMGDTLPVNEHQRKLAELGLNLEQFMHGVKTEVRFVPGFEFSELSHYDEDDFSQLSWRISSQSNKVGSRLEGPRLSLRSDTELLSYGLVSGLVQLPPDGLPIVLMADAQTMGGYPRLGYIPDSELSKLARNESGTIISLVPIDAATADYEYERQVSILNKIRCFAEIY